MDHETAADSKSKGKTPDTHATYMANSCQGKVAEVFFFCCCVPKLA